METPAVNEDDILYLAPCRPAMILGVPLQGYLVCLSTVMIPLIIFGLPAVIPAGSLAGGMFYLLRWAFARDFNCVNVLIAWSLTRAVSPGRLTWGGTSIDPLPRKPRSFAEAMRYA